MEYFLRIICCIGFGNENDTDIDSDTDIDEYVHYDRTKKEDINKKFVIVENYIT